MDGMPHFPNLDMAMISRIAGKVAGEIVNRIVGKIVGQIVDAN
jgi:hypothetical protein